MTAATTPAVRTVRVLVVDDHPALRAGLEGLLCNEPDIECVGALNGTVGLLAAVRDLRPDVVVLDYALGTDDGLTACFRVKQQPHRPAVVLYSAYVDEVFTVPAAIAQADATVSKSAPIDDLLSAIHAAAAGTVPRPVLDPERVQAASARLLTEDLPIATMLLAGTLIAGIADILDTTTGDVRHRALRVIGRLQASQTADDPSRRTRWTTQAGRGRRRARPVADGGASRSLLREAGDHDVRRRNVHGGVSVRGDRHRGRAAAQEPLGRAARPDPAEPRPARCADDDERRPFALGEAGEALGRRSSIDQLHPSFGPGAE